jgi:hypothetical protein
MPANAKQGDSKGANEFSRQAQTEKSGGIVREFFGFMRANKKWWLAPIFLGLLGIGLLILVGGSAAAPFIYTLF